MAKKWTNKNLPGALHFVTGNVHQRRPIFTGEANCRAFLEERQSLKKKREAKLIAFVLMPDHLHLIVNPQDDNIQDGRAHSKASPLSVWLKLPRKIFFG